MLANRYSGVGQTHVYNTFIILPAHNEWNYNYFNPGEVSYRSVIAILFVIDREISLLGAPE